MLLANLHEASSYHAFLLFKGVFLGFGILNSSLYAQTKAVQTNHLEYGWNLLAFEIVPTNPSPASVFSTNAFKAVWTYDNGASNWYQFGRPTPGHSEQNGVLPMANIQVGRAYWAYFDGGFNTNWVINGLAPAPAVQPRRRHPAPECSLPSRRLA